MARFFSSALRILEDLYRFDDARSSIQRFDLEGDIQPVHDVSREAEFGAALGRFSGFFHAGARVAPAGAGQTRDSFSLYDVAPPGGATWDLEEFEQYWVWIMGAWAAVQSDGNEGNFTRATWYLFNQTLDGIGPGSTTAVQPQIVWSGTNDVVPSDLRAAADFRGVLPEASFRFPLLAFPIRPASDNVQLAVQHSGACAVNGGLILWAGKRGTLPPGHG